MKTHIEKVIIDDFDKEKAKTDFVYFATHCLIDARTGKPFQWSRAQIEQLKKIAELAESEDEKIRKALISAVKKYDSVDGIEQEKVLAWLEKQDKHESTSHVANGVYYVKKDGSYIDVITAKRYVTKNKGIRDYVAKLGIAHDGHYFALPLNWDIYGKTRLTDKDSYPTDEYCICEADALLEWNFIKHTRHIQELGTSINLQDGHYIPTPAVLLAMRAYKDDINGALSSLGIKEIDWNSDFWSCCRCDTYGAWNADGGYGFFGYDNMYNAFVCVPVSLWEPLSEAS